MQTQTYTHITPHTCLTVSMYVCCACKLCYSIVVDLLTQTIIFHVFIFLNGNIYLEYSINLGIVLTSKHIFVCDQKCAKALHVKLILNVRMIGWPVGDRLAEPPMHQPYLSGFSLSLAKSSKDNEESQERSVRSAARKKEKVARAVSAAAGKH